MARMVFGLTPTKRLSSGALLRCAANRTEGTRKPMLARRHFVGQCAGDWGSGEQPGDMNFRVFLESRRIPRPRRAKNGPLV